MDFSKKIKMNGNSLPQALFMVWIMNNFQTSTVPRLKRYWKKDNGSKEYIRAAISYD
ncbi:MAG: hypothetical protein RBR67_20500 [Desulfobacterium sp.]|nr:hypothetical protein [Desulfobacterium sp.]